MWQSRLRHFQEEYGVINITIRGHTQFNSTDFFKSLLIVHMNI